MTRVVMGLLFEQDGRILIAKRNKTKRYGGLWEFPGGKIEAGETVEQALRREILEELDAPIKVGEIFPAYLFEYQGLRAEFIPVSGSVMETDITLLEHDAYRFITLEEIALFDFSPYDNRAIELLRERFND